MLFYLCHFSFERQSIHTHLLYHSEQTIAAGWRKMIFQPDGFDEIEIVFQNFIGRMTGYHLYQQGDDAFYDEGITFGLEFYLAVYQVGLQPYAALATIYQVLVILVFRGKRFLFVAEVYQ